MMHFERVVESSAISPPILKTNAAPKSKKPTVAELRAQLMAKMNKKKSQAKAAVIKPKPVLTHQILKFCLN